MSNTYFIKRTNCPSCKSSDLDTVYSCKYNEDPVSNYIKNFYSSYSLEWINNPKYLSDADYVLYECRICNLIFQKHVPNDILMELLYSCDVGSPQSVQRKKHKEQKNNFNYYINTSREIEVLIDVLKKKPQELVFFEFGMGWAEWLLMAKAFGCKVFGNEMANDQIRNAELVNIPNVAWSDIPKNKFDFIQAEQVFEHISEPLETLLHLKEALKPDGIIKISVPNGINVKRFLEINNWTSITGLKNSLNAVSPLEHINCFNNNSLIKMAKMAGLYEYKIPLRTQYRFVSNWESFRSIIVNIIKPIYTNHIEKNTCLYFKKQS